jgi:hypothetical protein
MIHRLEAMIRQFHTSHEDLRAAYGENPNRKRDQERQAGAGASSDRVGLSCARWCCRPLRARADVSACREGDG